MVSRGNDAIFILAMLVKIFTSKPRIRWPVRDVIEHIAFGIVGSMKFINSLKGTTESEGSILTVDDIRRTLNADVLCCEERLGDSVATACGCDLMSDVLSFTKPGSVLLTGLTNGQVIRTAEILDLKAVVFVRNKKPDSDTVRLAEECGIPLLTTRYPLYESCGLLFAKGLRGCIDVG